MASSGPSTIGIVKPAMAANVTARKNRFAGIIPNKKILKPKQTSHSVLYFTPLDQYNLRRKRCE
jgi:hypothetical protein